MEGRLGYRKDTQRYGFIVCDSWDDGEYFCWDGIHCGDCMDVLIDGEWMPTSMEMDRDGWYLVGTPFHGNLENIVVRTCDRSRFDPDIR